MNSGYEASLNQFDLPMAELLALSSTVNEKFQKTEKFMLKQIRHVERVERDEFASLC